MNHRRWSSVAALPLLALTLPPRAYAQLACPEVAGDMVLVRDSSPDSMGRMTGQVKDAYGGLKVFHCLYESQSRAARNRIGHGYVSVTWVPPDATGSGRASWPSCGRPPSHSASPSSGYSGSFSSASRMATAEYAVSSAVGYDSSATPLRDVGARLLPQAESLAAPCGLGPSAPSGLPGGPAAVASGPTPTAATNTRAPGPSSPSGWTGASPTAAPYSGAPGTNAPAGGQGGAPGGWVLYRVASAAGPAVVRFKSPVLIEADASGGQAVVDLVYSGRCSLPFLPPPRDREEQVRFTWRFDKDIRYLQPDETLTVTLTAGIKGNCGRDHFARPNNDVIVSEIARSLSEQERRELKGMLWAKETTPAEAQILASEGTGSVAFKALGAASGPGRMYFAINLMAFSDFEGLNWQVAYMYETLRPSTPPGDVMIRNDTPGRSSPTTARIPTSGGNVPQTGGAVPGGSPSSGGTPSSGGGGAWPGGTVPGGGSAPGGVGPGSGGSGPRTGSTGPVSSNPTAAGTPNSGGGVPGTSGSGGVSAGSLIAFISGPDPEGITPLFWLGPDGELHHVQTTGVAARCFGSDWMSKVRWCGDTERRIRGGECRSDFGRLRGNPIREDAACPQWVSGPSPTAAPYTGAPGTSSPSGWPSTAALPAAMPGPASPSGPVSGRDVTRRQIPTGPLPLGGETRFDGDTFIVQSAPNFNTYTDIGTEAVADFRAETEISSGRGGKGVVGLYLSAAGNAEGHPGDVFFGMDAEGIVAQYRADDGWHNVPLSQRPGPEASVRLQVDRAFGVYHFRWNGQLVGEHPGVRESVRVMLYAGEGVSGEFRRFGVTASTSSGSTGPGGFVSPGGGATPRAGSDAAFCGWILSEGILGQLGPPACRCNGREYQGAEAVKVCGPAPE